MGLALVCRGLYLDPGGGWAWSFAWKNCGCSCDILIMAGAFLRSFVGPLAQRGTAPCHQNCLDWFSVLIF